MNNEKLKFKIIVNENAKSFKKSSLRTGMRVSFKNGLKGIILLGIDDNSEGIINIIDMGMCINLNNIAECLKHYNSPIYDIIKVEKAINNDLVYLISDIKLVKYTTIWEESEVMTISIDDIAEKFNINSNNIKIVME